MRVLVTGGTGYIGRSLVRALVHAGHDVTGIARDPKKAATRAPAAARWLSGDLADPAGWTKEVAGHAAVIHAAMDYAANTPALDRAAIEGILGAAKSAKAPITVVYTSGIWVLGATGDRGADESAPTTNAAPLIAWRPAHERLALETAAPVTGVVLRPGMVYGQQAGLFAPFFADAKKGARHVGDGQNRWPGVHVDDLADLYLRIVEQAPAKLAGRPASERVFHGTDGVADRVREIARAAAQAAGGLEPVSTPLDEARKHLGPFADALAQDQVITSARSTSVLGWSPRWRGFVRNAADLFAEWQRQG